MSSASLLRPYLLAALVSFSPAFAGGEQPKKGDIPTAVPPRTFYRNPLSYSTTRDPDPPRYVHPATRGGLGFLRDASWLDLGLDYRFRHEYRDGDLRRERDVVDQPFLHRTRFYIGVHDALDPFRFAFELQDSRRYHSHFERDNRDVNEFAVIRLQAELYFKNLLPVDPLGNARPVSIRYGVQNFEFLDRRLLGNNQWRNTANTFLGFRGAIGQDANDWSIDLLAVQPLDREKYAWDDPIKGQWIYGVIGHWRRWSDLITIEPFYLALDQNRTATAEDRFVHSPGLRAYGVFGKSGFDFDFQALHQFGHSGSRDVDAWGGNVEIGYRFEHAWKSRLSAFYGYASGDKNPNDDQDNRFERFYGFGRPWSANDYIVFENISTPKVRLELTPTEKLRVDLGYSWYWLASDTDRLNAANNARDRSGRSGSSIGHEFDIRARWQITKKLETIVGYAHFVPGDFTRNVIRPGDTNFAYLEVNLNLF